jgi:hypothetical protein
MLFMADSEYLKSLTSGQLEKLKIELHKRTGGLCYICEELINLASQRTDIDHIKALELKGDDDKHNLAITHAGCNRSKGIRDLQLQRHIARFRKLVSEKVPEGTIAEMITVGDVLQKYGGSIAEIAVEEKPPGFATLFYEVGNQARKLAVNLLVDEQNDRYKSFVGMIPKEVLFHDPEINPRSIVDLEPMIEEFYQKRPQLQPSLAYILLDKSSKGKVMLFDGQHKAAAQIINNADRLFVRVFINPDLEELVKTNYRAHTKLAQIHFPQLIADKIAHSIFSEEFGKYVNDMDIIKGSEKKFIDRLSAEMKSEFRNYLKGYYKYEVLSSNSVKLMRYVETVSSRSKRYPLAFESLRKGLLEIFLFLQPADDDLAITQRTRNLERDNMQTIMNIIAEEILVDKFKPEVGIHKIEQRLQDNDPKITHDHLLAYRMLRQSALIAWAEQFRDALVTHLISRNKYQKDWHKKKFLWVKFEDEDLKLTRKMIRYIKSHPAWTAKETNLVNQLTTTKVGDWRTIITEGKLPGSPRALYDPMNSGQILSKAITMR